MKRQRTSDSAPYRCLITLISALFVATAVSASSTFEKPDFAYPRDVIRDADAALARVEELRAGGLSLKEAAARAAAEFGLKKRQLYDMALGK